MKALFISIALVISASVFSQNQTEQTKIKDYLDSTLQNKNTLLISNALQNVTASDIYQSELLFSTSYQDGHNILQLQYFIKTADKLIAFKDRNDLLASSAFIKSLNAKKFKLKTEDDGVAFQSLLKLLDNERGLGFFIEDNTWYFNRETRFGETMAYVVTTANNGQISTIVYENDLKKTLPETLLQSGETIDFTGSGAVISKKDSAFMHQYLLDNVNYEFEITALNFYSLNTISTLSINKCNLKVTEGEEGNSFTNNIPYMLISNNGEYIKTSIDGLLEMPIFLNSLQKKYTLKTEDDARLFQYVLDDLSPVSKFDIELKTFYKKDNMWFFVREKRFDDLKGFIVLIDSKNKVNHIEYTTISEESIIRLKMKDPSFKVDYKFKLAQPTTNKVTLQKGEGLNIEVSFDEAVVNASGCWILTRRDGSDSGTYAGNNLHSPYKQDITGMSLEGNHHVFEYFLLKNETMNAEDALSTITVEVEIK